MKIDQSPQARDPEDTMRSAFMEEPFSGISSNDWYLSGVGERNRNEVRDEFIADDSMADPGIAYKKLATIDDSHGLLEKRYTDLLEKARVSGDDIFYEQVARKMAEMYRHKEVQRRLGGEVIDVDLSLRRAETMNEEIFGEIKQEDFDVVLSKHIENAHRVKDELPQAQELLDLLGSQEPTSLESFDFELKPETLHVLREDLFAILPQLKDVLAEHEDRPVGMDEAAEWANKMLVALEMDKDGWRAAKAPKKRAANANVPAKLIEFGEQHADFKSTTDMNTVILHEVVGHGYRSFQAEHQDDPARQSKMPGTTDFEEGFATGLEQLLSGKSRIAGQRYVLALGLGKGMDRQGQARNFRETYEILYRSLMVEQAANGKAMTELDAKRKAYAECNRTRRGGAIDMRDASYFLGAKKSYQWMNEIATLPESQRREKLQWVLSGLFDPTNSSQAELFTVHSESQDL